VAATAVVSVRKPTGREVVGGRRMGEPLIAGPIPSTAAGATHELRDEISDQIITLTRERQISVRVAFAALLTTCLPYSCSVGPGRDRKQRARPAPCGEESNPIQGHI
jgi:hypothetical protein